MGRGEGDVLGPGAEAVEAVFVVGVAGEVGLLGGYFMCLRVSSDI